MLRAADDGAGVPRDKKGRPDILYVTTHVCDSVEQRLKRDGAEGIQGKSASACSLSGRWARH